MNPTILLPKLPLDRAESIRQALLQKASGSEAFTLDALDNALQAPHSFAVTGGTRVSRKELLDFRARCLLVADSARTSELGFGAAFDLGVGEEIASTFTGARGELGSSQVWDFLTLVLLPDLAVARVTRGRDTDINQGSTRRRLTGGDRRHIFSKLWLRWMVFGSEIVMSRQLTEDDYVAMLERRLTLEQPQLARLAAQQIIQSGYSRGTRRDYARQLLRGLVQISGIVHLGDDDVDAARAALEHLHRTITDS